MAEWSANEIVGGTGDAAFASYESGRVAAWNQAAQELLGYSPDEVLGVPSETLLSQAGTITTKRPEARFRARAKHSDGRLLPLGISVVRLPRPAGTSPLLLHIMVPEEPRPSRPGAITSTGAHATNKPANGGLTPRETEILRLLADGVPAQAIAGQLIIGLTTVRTHIRNILQKLRVHSQLEAVALAFRAQLI